MLWVTLIIVFIFRFNFIRAASIHGGVYIVSTNQSKGNVLFIISILLSIVILLLGHAL
jgi:hypothetical protein